MVERQGSTSWSESSVNFDGCDEEFEEIQEESLVRFSSASSPGTPICDSAVEQFVNMKFEPPIGLDAFDTSLDFSESFLMPSDPVSTTLFFPENHIPSYCDGGLLQNRVHSQTALVRPAARARPTISTRVQSVKFFLHFHRQTITESHYFLYFDYNKFVTTTLLAMAQGSDALRHAVVAFSALIYSIKGDRIAREQAFENYEISLQQLRVLLDKAPMTIEERQAATVTALQLATFDVLTPSVLWLILAVFRRCSKLFSTSARRSAYNTKVF